MDAKSLTILPAGHTVLSSDRRPIRGIFVEGADRVMRVGEGPITAIVAYDENGECSHTPWLAVLHGTLVARRIPARLCEVFYDTPSEADDLIPF